LRTNLETVQNNERKLKDEKSEYEIAGHPAGVSLLRAFAWSVGG
jgi:hypothetical protein